MTTFEDLKKYEFTDSLDHPIENCFEFIELQKDHLSKQRVREAIDEFLQLDEQDAVTMILNNALKKRLGL